MGLSPGFHLERPPACKARSRGIATCDGSERAQVEATLALSVVVRSRPAPMWPSGPEFGRRVRAFG
jgi:hypothetical protein